MSGKTPGQKLYETCWHKNFGSSCHWAQLVERYKQHWERAAVNLQPSAVMQQRNVGMTDDERRLYIAVRANVFGRLYVSNSGATNRKPEHAAEEADHAGMKAVEMMRNGEFRPVWFEVTKP